MIKLYPGKGSGKGKRLKSQYWTGKKTFQSPKVHWGRQRRAAGIHAGRPQKWALKYSEVDSESRRPTNLPWNQVLALGPAGNHFCAHLEEQKAEGKSVKGEKVASTWTLISRQGKASAPLLVQSGTIRASILQSRAEASLLQITAPLPMGFLITHSNWSSPWG